MRSIPILCYHAVEAGPAPLCLPRDVFARHVEILAGAGCVTLTLDEVAGHILAGRPFPDRAVALTFDDGYASVHEAALPLLAAAGFVATVFPVTGQLGGASVWNATADLHLPLLTSGQLGELRDAGWEVGGHTHSHRPLPALPPDEVARELTRSNGILEDLLQEPVRTFAYPFGAHDASVRSTAAGSYRVCATIGASRAGLGSAPDAVERIEAWYLQPAWHVRHLHDRIGSAYLAVRRAGRRVRLRLT